MSVEGVMSRPPKPVDLAAIERELASLWRHEDAGDAEHPVVRACMSNLIVACRTGDEAAVIANEIPAIVARHPSRVFLLLMDATADGARLDSYVTTHARVVDGRQQVVSEHITIEARGTATRRVPAVVRQLLIGDLPTALWWATPEAPPRGGEVFAELADLTHQVIYDSLGWPDPPRHMVATATWATGERIRQAVSDLAWRRLKLWRRLLAQALDPAVAPGVLETVREVAVQHGPHAMTQAWLLTGWLALRLGWRPGGGKVIGGTEAVWQFQAPHGVVPVTIHRLGEGQAEIETVRVVGAPRGKSTTLSCANAGPGRLAVTSDAAPAVVRTLSAPPQDRADLVARQLPDLARDQLFQDCLTFARAMAQTLLR
ncbi:MAG: glucose-6-phosphate dehydrogenase assembly protein OpcA [Candidatus Rokubacteria bacterium]|nr:glucose-6-phosphate dehydrogenase assembly protein OpcA [Candidatus Rokubacteria bacterium]